MTKKNSLLFLLISFVPVSVGQSSLIGSISVVAPTEGPPVNVRQHIWSPVPGLSTAVMSEAGDNLAITVSAEMFQTAGIVFMRAMVDGQVASPSDVAFKMAGDFDGVRSFTFIKQNVQRGQHRVEIQWSAGAAAASIRDRTLVVHSEPSSGGASVLAAVSPASGPAIFTSSISYQDIPGLAVSFAVTAPGSLAATFSAEGNAESGRLYVRALVDNVKAGEVVFDSASAGGSGTNSYTFTLPNLAAGVHSVRLQWMAPSGSAWLGDRSLVVSSTESQEVATPSTNRLMTFQDPAWVDIPSTDLRFNTAEPISNAAVSLSTQVRAAPGRLILRALLDGEPASPGNVTLVQNAPDFRAGTYMFVLKNVLAGSHHVRFQALVDPGTSAGIWHFGSRVLWKRRAGADYVQPFRGMAPISRNFQLLVICFDPVRPGHTPPTALQIRSTFEGKPGLVFENRTSAAEAAEPALFDAAIVGFPLFDKGPNARDWFAENSGGATVLGQVQYSGCTDGGWHLAPPGRRGNWYWDNGAFDQMWKDALAAADATFDFHAYDRDRNNVLSNDELIVAVIRPQNDPYGTARGTSLAVDGNPTPLSVAITDLYLSRDEAKFLVGVGLAAHELSHQVIGAEDLYGVCAAVSPGLFSVMANHTRATHLDPFHKLKNGFVSPQAIDLNIQQTTTIALGAVEAQRQILLLRDPSRAGKEMFLIENRFPGTPTFRNYDSPLPGAIVVWQIFEDTSLVTNAAVCPADVRYVRMRAVLSQPGQGFDLAWADGSPAGFRVIAASPGAAVAQVTLQKQ